MTVNIDVMKNKVVVITGAASGMGRELALQYAKMGCRLALADLSADSLDSVASEAENLGAAGVFKAMVNIADEAEVNQFSKAVLSHFSGVDIVLNNAGIAAMGDFDDTSPEVFKQVIDVNFWGVVYGSRAFLPALKASSGSLVNISSLFGLIGVPGQVSYCASKFAVRGFTESLRQEVEPDGVHVACVHPGGVRTSIARNAIAQAPGQQQQDDIDEIEAKALTMPASRAAEIIRRGVERRRARILIGRDAKTLDFIVRLLPVLYSRAIALFMPKK